MTSAPLTAAARAPCLPCPQGVDNVYCQHTPLLVNTLGSLRDGSLNTQAYPYMGTTVRGGVIGAGSLGFANRGWATAREAACSPAT